MMKIHPNFSSFTSEQAGDGYCGNMFIHLTDIYRVLICARQYNTKIQNK